MEVFAPLDKADEPELEKGDYFDPGFFGYRTTASAAKHRLTIKGLSFESSLKLLHDACLDLG